MKKITFILLAIVGMLFNSYACADFVYTKQGYWGEGNKYAISGYDATSYFDNSKPIKGNKDYSTKYNGAIWLFANNENKSKFNSNPQKYSPQYGGHCAWREAQDGKEVYGDPTIWTIVDDKLYLNYNKSVNNLWVKDIPGFIKSADNFWLQEFDSTN